MAVEVIDFQSLPADPSSSSRRQQPPPPPPPPPLNPLSRRLREYVLVRLRRAIDDGDVTSVVLTGGGGGHLSAGADLTEFASIPVAPPSPSTTSSSRKGRVPASEASLLDVVREIEQSPKPVVAAIDGTCLGGGLEVALACHYRVATSAAKLGLPEVHVGVIPGAGGTQRLPRLIGLQPALTMILTGAPVPARKAHKLGMVDAVVEKTTKSAQQSCLLDVARKWAEFAEVMPLQDRRLSSRSVNILPAQAHGMLHVAGLQLPPPDRGGEGVHAALEAVRAACFSSSFEQGMEVEGKLFLQVMQSRQGKARRYAFFAARQAQKPVSPSSSSLRSKNHPLLQKDVSNTQVAVIGAGTMGSGIALVLLQAGFAVWLVDVNGAALAKGLAFLKRTVEAHVKRGKLSPKQAQRMQQLLRSTQCLSDLSDCELVVEAVIENLKIKQQIFRTLSQVVSSPTALLLSNTSTLDIDKMAEAAGSSRSSRVAGWHFFSPAHVMQLVEIVTGARTSDETVSILQALTKRIKKIGVVVGNCDGFCGNRMLKPYGAETVLLVTEGLSVQQVDNAFLQFGMALGPLQMSDLAGNDINYNIRRERGWVRESPNDPVPPKRPSRYTELADVMVSKFGRTGQKAGKGWYDYDPAIGKGRKGLPSKEMKDLIRSYATSTDSQSLSPEEIVERVLFPLVNEGFKCLEESIARSPGDIDVVYLYGYGFPAWRGGPMYWADNEIGLPRLLATLQEFSRRFPDTEHFVPSKLLEECVRLGVTVETYYKKRMHDKGAPRSRL